MTIDEDYELVRRAREGDVDQFRGLVEKYQQKIYFLIYGIVLDRGLAEDLTQETFIKAYRSLPRFEGKSKVFTWIYRIALNLALDAKKRRKFVLVEFNENHPHPDYGPSSQSFRPDREALRIELQNMILKGLRKLNRSQRTTLFLREWEGLSYQEIAETMKCSVGTVMSRLHYARGKLGKYLKDYLSLEPFTS